jgi:PAS domain S-box-containing protein
MKNLTAAAVLSEDFLEVTDSTCWNRLDAKAQASPHFAVFGQVHATEAFPAGSGHVLIGLISKEEAQAKPDTAFRELVKCVPPTISVGPATTLDSLISIFGDPAQRHVAVVDVNGHLAGVVTRGGVLQALLSALNQDSETTVPAEDLSWQLVTNLANACETSTAFQFMFRLLDEDTIDRSFLEKALNQLTRSVGARYGALTVIANNGEIEEFVYAGLTAEQASCIGHPPTGRGLLGAIDQTARVTHVSDISLDPRHTGFPDGHPHMQSMLAAPLRASGELVGRVYLCDKENGEPFTEKDEALIRCFAHVIANVVRRRRDDLARIRLETEKDVLRSLTHQLLTVTFLHDIIQVLAHHTASLLGYHTFAYFEYDSYRSGLRFLFRQQSTTNPSTGRVLAEVADTIIPCNETSLLEPLLACFAEPGDEVDSKIRQHLGLSAMERQCYLRVPLSHGGELVGVVVLISQSGHRYQPHHVAMLQSLLVPCTIAAIRVRREEENRMAQEKLEKAQTRYRAILRSTPHGLCMLTPNWEISFANHAFHMLFDPDLTTTHDVIGTSLEALFPVHEDFETFVAQAQAEMEEVGRYCCDITLVRRSGAQIQVEISIVPLDPKRAEGGYVATFTDVTQRAIQTEALRRERDFSRMIVDTANVLVFVVDRTGRIRRFNRSCEAVSGWRAEDVLGMNFCALFLRGDEDAALSSATLDEVLHALFPTNGELTLISRTGEPRVIRCKSSVQVDKDGQVAHVICIGEDLTESRREAADQRELGELAMALAPCQSVAEMAAELPSLLFRRWEISHVFLWSRDPFSFEFVLEAATLPQPLNDVMAVLSDLVKQDELLSQLTAGDAILKRVREHADVASIASLLGDAKTTSPAILFIPLIVRDSLSAIVGILSPSCQHLTVRDLDYARRTGIVLARIYERLRTAETNNLLTAAVAQSPEAIVLTDRQWRVYYANPAFEGLLGQGTEKLLGRNIREILPLGDLPIENYKRYEESLHADRAVFENVCFHFPGRPAVDMRLGITPIYSPSGRLQYFRLSLIDLTRQLEMERLLQRSQRMEALGYLAGGIAHDFNNLLHIATGYTQLALRFANPNDAVREQLEGIQRVIRRGAALTNQLLTFSKAQIAEPALLDLSHQVEQSLQLIRRVIGEDIVVEADLAKDLPTVLLTPAHLDQVVMNLALNARDAMPSGGTLRITSELSFHGPPGREQDPASRWVVLSVSDTGLGMSPETLEHIFEPFFTTKGVGQGTGLGLSTVYGIVKQAGGEITVDSQLGKGTTFRVFLPVVEIAPNKSPADETVMPSPPPPEKEAITVLLVEDDPDVRALTRLMLLSRGYAVIPAENGRVALDMMSKMNGNVDIVLSDVVMPEMGGLEFGRVCRQLHPDLPFVYISGYPATEMEQLATVTPHFLAKPIEAEELDRKLRLALSLANF